jgi:O-antigen/teichoic acid export membrane protein
MNARAGSGGGPSVEQEIAALCAGAAARRAAERTRLRSLIARADWPVLVELLRGGRLLPLLGPRILAASGEQADPGLDAAVAESLAAGRRQAALLHMVSERIIEGLRSAGIRSAALKGSLLAEAIYGDPGRRQSSDVDLLVAGKDLGAAVEVARALGYATPADHVGVNGLPLLHFSLAHERAELPPVELHWRVHWYESSFASERLLPPDLDRPSNWRPAPADEFASLLLYYARDGFTGLRQATDLGAWWDRFGAEVGDDALAELARAYPRLRPVLAAATGVAQVRIGLDRDERCRRLGLGARTRVAVRLSSRARAYRSREQLFAQIGLIDGLLTPRGGFAAFVRRQIAPPAAVIREHAEKDGDGARPGSTAGYAMRTLARFCLALAGLLRPSGGIAAGRRGTYRAGFFFGALSFLASAGLGFVSTIVTARLYGVEVIGEFALVWAPVAVMWTLSSIKEQQALIKEITQLKPREPRVTQLFAAVFTFSVGLTVAVALLDAGACLVLFPGPLHAPELLVPALVSIAGYTVVLNTGWNLDSILSAFVAGRALFWVRLNELVSFIVIATGIGLTWRSVWGLVIATIGASLTALIQRAIVARSFARPHLSLDEYRAGLRTLPELLRFGLKATPGQMAQGVSQQGGIWAIGMVAPIAVVGAYSRALVIPKSLQTASMRITEVLYPTLVGRHSENDGHGFDRALVDSIRYEVVGMLLFAAAIGGAAHSVLDIFGPGFAAAAPALVLLALYPALASVTVTQTQALWAVDRPGLTSLVAIVRLIVTVALLVLLTPGLHMVGPAIALLGGFLAVIALSGAALRRHLSRPLRVTWPIRERLALLPCYAAGFGAAHALERVGAPVVSLPLALISGAIAFAAAFVLCGGLNRRDRRRLAEAVTWARSRRSRRADRPSLQPQG